MPVRSNLRVEVTHFVAMLVPLICSAQAHIYHCGTATTTVKTTSRSDYNRVTKKR
jgi:hypothetical protein